MIILKRSKIIISIICMLSILFFTNNIFALENNEIKVNSKEEQNSRDLYRNQFLTSKNSFSSPVLTNKYNGTVNFDHLGGPGGSEFIGFKTNDPEKNNLSVSGAANSDINILYSVYKLNIYFQCGNNNIASIGNRSSDDPNSCKEIEGFCSFISPNRSCKVKTPLITPTSEKYSGIWGQTKDATTGVNPNEDYEVTTNGTPLYANANMKHKVIYDVGAGSSEGNISGYKCDGDNYCEYVNDGGNIKRDQVFITPPEGQQFDAWYTTVNVTLNDGKIINAGDAIHNDEVTKIIVNSDLDLRGNFKAIQYTIGDCDWKIENGVLTIYSSTNNSCLMSSTTPGEHPWKNFYNNITSVVIDENVIANPNSSYLFSRLPNVTTIDLSKLDTSGVTDMSHLFEGDNNLRSIVFPNSFVTSNVTDTSSMFKGCENLTSLDLTSFDTSNVNNMKEMFSGCSKLENIQIDTDKFKTNNVTDVTNMLKGTTISIEKIDSLNIDTSSVNVDISYLNPEPKIVLRSSDENKTIDIAQPENGGSGRYTYELINTEPLTEGITINGDKIIIGEDVSPGVYEVKIKVIDIVRDDVETEITYTITIKEGSIDTPQMPTLESIQGENFVYKSTDIKLKCISNSSYNNGEKSYFEFGYSDKNNTIPSNWSYSQDGSYIIQKSSQDVGIRYYFCREKAILGDKTSDYSIGSPVKISISNATLIFDTSNGGTISGNSTLYVRYGYTDSFNSLYGEDVANYPTASMNGYSFNGFYTFLSGGKKVINPDGSLERDVAGYTSNGKWIITGTKKLYAQYTKKQDPTPISYYGKLSMLRGYLSKYKVVTLLWSKTPGADGYQVCYKKSSDKSYKCYNNGSLKQVILKEGTKYDFKVSPYIKSNGKYIISPNGKTVSIYTLKKMNAPKVVKKSNKEVKITYTKIKGTTGYKVYYSTKKNKGYKLIKTLGSSKNSVKFKPKKGKKYYYRVRAYKKDNNKTVYSPYSNSKKYILK